MGSETTFTGYYDDLHNLFVEAAMGLVGMSMQVVVPVGQVVGVGTYTNGIGGVVVHLRGGNGELCTSDVQQGSVTISEFAASNDRVTKLAAFVQHRLREGHRGARLSRASSGSTRPWRSRHCGITPAAIAWPVAHAFGTVPAGDSSRDVVGGTVGERRHEHDLGQESDSPVRATRSPRAGSAG